MPLCKRIWLVRFMPCVGIVFDDHAISHFRAYIIPEQEMECEYCMPINIWNAGGDWLGRLPKDRHKFLFDKGLRRGGRAARPKVLWGKDLGSLVLVFVLGKVSLKKIVLALLAHQGNLPLAPGQMIPEMQSGLAAGDADLVFRGFLPSLEKITAKRINQTNFVIVHSIVLSA